MKRKTAETIYYSAVLLACAMVWLWLFLGCASPAVESYQQLDDLRLHQIKLLEELNAKKDSAITMLQFTIDEQSRLIAVHDTLDQLMGCKK